MSAVRIVINLGSDALSGDNAPSEVATILRRLAEYVESESRVDRTSFAYAGIRDVNGNVVGRAYVGRSDVIK